MIRGVGASKLGMAAEQSRTEILANNLANVNTNGFKKSVAVSAEFQTMLLQRIDDNTDGARPSIGALGNGVTLEMAAQIETQGSLVKTDRTLDFAIEGPGWFAAQGPNGVVYSRNGAFRQLDDGTLITVDNNPVLFRDAAGTLAPIVSQGAEPEIRPDGSVIIGGQMVGRLEIDGATAETKLHSGTLEASNVELSKEMTDLVVALRSFQVNQRAMQMQDQTLARAVTDIGKV